MSGSASFNALLLIRSTRTVFESPKTEANRISLMYELDDLRNRLAQYERNATKTSWLVRQLRLKIRHFPRDFLRRLRRSAQKRRAQRIAMGPLQNQIDEVKPVERGASPFFSHPETASLPFLLHPEYADRLEALVASHPANGAVLTGMREFYLSEKMRSLVERAIDLEPDIGNLSGHEQSYFPPWHDLDYHRLRSATNAIPPGPYDSVVLMPAGRMGGADLVAAVLARALAVRERVLILRTDDTDWDRPDWYPDGVASVDISEPLGAIADPRRALYTILCEIGAPRIFNVNSRRAFETFSSHGGRLASQFRLYAYYFCADRTERGIETGYPVWFFANIFPHLTAALIDTRDLARTLVNRFAVPAAEVAKVRTIYTPSQLEVLESPLAQQQVDRAGGRRPCILWAGRLDRQKRFDLAIAVARAMPDVDFRCWGKAVLDAPPKLKGLPSNLVVNPPFDSYDELPLTDCDGWLYTSSWDGLPTILIELGALGMPIAANAVGGVPELIDETTGWLFEASSGAVGAIEALRSMLSNPDLRIARARALQQRVRVCHSMTDYVEKIAAI
ncbi:glycosyltransferase [Aminobacter anthyllidis]|uniref:glycosyltransferase n=1 Tax=Aminobacter anthyllidis TaxID=1035067 RepID=UPI0024586695|nr:glycosyltransferase [Aminobacter anthyllidis]MDH4984420.1 glycosyltransferase [Aminobacter anthyllidis]